MATRRQPAVAALVLGVAAAVSACGTTNDAAGAESPTCEQIEAFAEQLVDTGITYDYEPTDGPADHEGERIVVSVPHATAANADAHTQAAVAGTPVIVFAHAWSPAPGDLVASVMEGFLTACPGKAPIGFAASYRGWSAMSSLDDVATAVEEGQQ